VLEELPVVPPVSHSTQKTLCFSPPSVPVCFAKTL
jgi:hypothetical protein